MKPFLFNEVFEVNTDVAVKNAPLPSIPAVFVDGFLKRPAEARAVVGSAPAANWKYVEGGRNFVDYYDCRLRFPVWFPNQMISLAHQIVLKVYSTETRPQDPGVDVNWFMQIRGKRGEYAVPHADITGNVRRSFTCIVYLNDPAECSGGTAFFRFRKSGSLVVDEAYQRATLDSPRIVESGRDYWMDDPGEFWEMVGAIDMLPGRLLVFPSEYFHAAYHPKDSFYAFPRLTLAFWLVC